jgi:hypothetical protein
VATVVVAERDIGAGGAIRRRGHHRITGQRSMVTVAQRDRRAGDGGAAASSGIGGDDAKLVVEGYRGQWRPSPELEGG